VPALPDSQSLPGTRPPTYPPSQAQDPTSDLHVEQVTIQSNNCILKCIFTSSYDNASGNTVLCAAVRLSVRLK
jgi:hypothetical protein